MKRILLTLMLITLAAVRLQADDEFQEKKNPTANPPEQLVNMEQAADKSRVLDLERRLSDLERNYRFLDDRVRTLDRSLDDLKRRR